MGVTRMQVGQTVVVAFLILGQVVKGDKFWWIEEGGQPFSENENIAINARNNNNNINSNLGGNGEGGEYQSDGEIALDVTSDDTVQGSSGGVLLPATQGIANSGAQVGSCPAADPSSPCSGGSNSECWSVGQSDVDCIGDALCCFDGCANICQGGAGPIPGNPRPQDSPRRQPGNGNVNSGSLSGSKSVQGNPGTKQRNPVRQQENPVRQQGDPVGQQGNPERQQGHPVRQQGDPVRQQGNPVRQKGNPGGKQRNPVRQQENSGRQQGIPGRKQGNSLSNSKPIKGPQGYPGTPQGNPGNTQTLSGSQFSQDQFAPKNQGPANTVLKTGGSGQGQGQGSGQGHGQATQRPFIRCPSAMLCVPKTSCDFDGVISKDFIQSDPIYEDQRVPLIPCFNRQKGNRVDVCCRDPDYEDPWPQDNSDNNNNGNRQNNNSRNRKSNNNGNRQNNNGGNGQNTNSGNNNSQLYDQTESSPSQKTSNKPRKRPNGYGK